jgi:hypothetical protein
MYLFIRTLFVSTLLLSLTSNLQAAPPTFDLDDAKACEAALRSLGVKFKVNKPVEDQDECGSPRPLNIKSLKGNIKIKSDTIVNLRCETALALARWMSEVVTPSTKLHLGVKPSILYLSTTYKCRRRNGDPKAKLSEHAYANAIDFLGIGFDSGDSMKIMVRKDDSDAMRSLQAAIRGGSCAYFTTVIGPMTNEAHSDHLHLDLAERKNGYRVCE